MGLQCLKSNIYGMWAYVGRDVLMVLEDVCGLQVSVVACFLHNKGGSFAIAKRFAKQLSERAPICFTGPGSEKLLTSCGLLLFKPIVGK